MVICMTVHLLCQKVVGRENLKALKQMQMRQSNSDHICLVKDVALNINRAVSLLRNVLQSPVNLKGNAQQMTYRNPDVFPE